jgi:hypothetical protein
MAFHNQHNNHNNCYNLNYHTNHYNHNIWLGPASIMVSKMAFRTESPQFEFVWLFFFLSHEFYGLLLSDYKILLEKVNLFHEKIVESE